VPGTAARTALAVALAAVESVENSATVTL